MTLNMAKNLAAIYAVGIVVPGLAYLIAPVSIFAILGQPNLSAAATTDVRATYAGIQIALGVYLWTCLGTRQGLETIYSLLGYALLGMGSTRLAGLFVDGGNQTINLFASAFEIGSACLSIYCLRIVRRAPSQNGNVQQ